jgi:YbbR domain-containing protein
VRVRGASGTLSRVGAGDVVAVLDIRGAQAGRRLFPLTPDQVRTPFGVEVVQVTPSAIAMAFEASASRQMPVVPAVDGRPAPGYIVGRRTADPPSVDVIGPESAVKRATEVMTEPVSVAGARDQVRQSVILGLEDPALRLKTARSAMVTVQILPAPLERMFRDRPVHLRNLAPNLDAQAIPATVNVSLRASRETLNRVEADDIVADINLAGLGSGLYSLTVQVHTDSSPEAGVTRIEPASVQVRVSSGKQ